MKRLVIINPTDLDFLKETLEELPVRLAKQNLQLSAIHEVIRFNIMKKIKAIQKQENNK